MTHLQTGSLHRSRSLNWIYLFAVYHPKCTCWCRQGLRGPFFQSYSKRLMSRRPIRWSGICQAISLGNRIVAWNVETSGKCTCRYGLVRFTVDWFTGLHFTIRLKLSLGYDTVSTIARYCLYDRGVFFQAGEKLKLFWINKPDADVCVCLSLDGYVWSHHMTSFHSWHLKALQLNRAKTTPSHLSVPAFSLCFYFSHILMFSICQFLFGHTDTFV